MTRVAHFRIDIYCHLKQEYVIFHDIIRGSYKVDPISSEKCIALNLQLFANSGLECICTLNHYLGLEMSFDWFKKLDGYLEVMSYIFLSYRFSYFNSYYSTFILVICILLHSFVLNIC